MSKRQTRNRAIDKELDESINKLREKWRKEQGKDPGIRGATILINEKFKRSPTMNYDRALNELAKRGVKVDVIDDE